MLDFQSKTQKKNQMIKCQPLKSIVQNNNTTIQTTTLWNERFKNLNIFCILNAQDIQEIKRRIFYVNILFESVCEVMVYTCEIC